MHKISTHTGTGQSVNSQEESLTTSRASFPEPVPHRRGSEYTDILLRNLDGLLLRESEAVVIGMASSIRRQGVTTTAVNLAVRAADHSMGPVLLIDANVRNRRLSRLYRCKKVGYGDCLAGNAALEDCVIPTNVEGLHVLGIGNRRAAEQIVPDPWHAEQLFKQIRDSYRLAIVDMPLFRDPTPSDSLCRYLDGVVAVTRCGTNKNSLSELQTDISDARGRLLGVAMTADQGNAMPNWLQRWFW